MNWQQLEYFKKIAETENFTEAANLLSVTQPALSKAISKLEEELEVSLFEKNGRNIRLTRYGSMFLKHAETAISEINEGIQELKDMVNPTTGTISIASLYTIGTHFIPTIISEFLNESPNIKFEYCMESTVNILKGLENGNFDLGFYDEIEANITNNKEVESIPIKREELVLIVPKNHHLAKNTEISLEDLKDENFVFYSERTKSKICSLFENCGFIPKVIMKPSQNSLIGTGFVSAGLGISVVPNTPNLKADGVAILKIKENHCYRTIHMGWRKNGNMSSSAEKFKEFIIEEISRMKF
ncbi:LysR family transcriptional regulator [Clostridium sp. YIM B02555]|uniref:LysR family transcriptional regulator n=1 Tax=Clostridium sp. YIM B02555 TaxID=2911968 RepID=UPI001EED5864|nr:LysR family transcriptional regulator [Clostridium sp. YIM B02555]